MHKIKVLMVTTFGGVGGIGKAVQVFLKFIDKEIFDVSICAVSNPEGPVAERIRMMEYEIFDANNDYDKIVEFIEDKQIDIVHVERAGWETLAIEAAAKAKVPVIIERSAFGTIDLSPYDKIVDRRLFISKFCALRYMKLMGISVDDFWKRSRVLYLPVDLEEFNYSNKSSSSNSFHKPTIGRIGRKDPTKWSKLLLDIVPKLAKKVPNVNYLIVGLPDEEVTNTLINDFKGNISFIDFLHPSEVPNFYKSLDVLAHSSRVGETFGYVIAESMASVTPVISTSTPLMDNAQVELIDNGKTGFVVNNADSFVAALSMLLSNNQLRTSMGKAAHDKVTNEYDASKVTRILEKIFLDALEEKGFEIDEDILRRYEKVQYSPSKEELEKFEKEYWMRLKDCYGGISLKYTLELLACRLLMRRSILQALVPFNLIKVRKIIRELRERML